MPEPQTTFSGDVKLSKERYQSILATAEQVSVMKKTLQRRETILDRKERELENRQKLPVKDQMELAKLRKFRDSVLRVFRELKEDNPVKKMLSKAMEEFGFAKKELKKAFPKRSIGKKSDNVEDLLNTAGTKAGIPFLESLVLFLLHAIMWMKHSAEI